MALSSFRNADRQIRQAVTGVPFKQKQHNEGHIIEIDYAKSGRARIADIDQFNKINVKWGKHDYYVYWRSKKTYARFKELIDAMSDPGSVRHIAFIADQKKCFILWVR